MRVSVARCQNADCQLRFVPYHPEVEGFYAFPKKRFGLDLVYLVGAVHRGMGGSATPSQVRRELGFPGMAVSLGSIPNLIDDFDALASGSLNAETLDILEKQGCISLAFGRLIATVEGFKSSVGLWFLEDSISQRVLAGELCEDCAPGHLARHYERLFSQVEGQTRVAFAKEIFYCEEPAAWRWSEKMFGFKERATFTQGGWQKFNSPADAGAKSRDT